MRRKGEERYGEYRTKRLILEIYDAMQKAMDTGVPYHTIVDPPPGQGPRHPEIAERHGCRPGPHLGGQEERARAGKRAGRNRRHPAWYRPA